MLDTVLRKSLTPVNSAFRVDTVRMMPIFQLKKLRLRKVSDLHRFTELVSGQEEFYCTIFPQSWSRNIANPKVTGFEYHPNTASKQRLGKGLVLTSMPELVPLSHVHWLLLPGPTSSGSPSTPGCHPQTQCFPCHWLILGLNMGGAFSDPPISIFPSSSV